MNTAANTITKLIALRNLSITAVLNTIIALLLAISISRMSFWEYFRYTQCIGLLMCIFALSGRHLFKPVSFTGRVVVAFSAVLLGTLTGLAVIIIGERFELFSAPGIYAQLDRIFSISVCLGIIISYCFVAQKKISDSKLQIEAERVRSLTLEKQSLESQLKLLQAQVEPHFLFNTLSNICGLIETDVACAKMIIGDLTNYLRNCLTESRKSEITLEKEIETIRLYLSLFKVRFGDRLSYSINLPQALEQLPIAPMLIQPLVENAILHGIGPSMKGGHVDIKINQFDGLLTVTIADTGKGFDYNSAPGVGLTNVRERLSGIYGNGACLLIKDNPPHGVIAKIQIRMEKRPN